MIADAYLRHVDLIEHEVVALAEAMPAELYGFRPAGAAFDDTRTFGEQVTHVATMIFMASAIVLQEKSPHGPGTNANGPDSVQGKAQVVEYLKASIAYARKAMGSLSEKNHLDPLKTYFGSQLRLEVANAMVFHTFDHYGQMVVYARLNGIVPPA